MLDVFEKLLALFQLPFTGWTVALCFFLMLLYLAWKERILKALNAFLDWLTMRFATRLGERRFEPFYAERLGRNHSYLRVVGLRTETVKPPTIAEAYVPIKLLPQGASLEYALTIEQMLARETNCLILGDPGVGKSTVLDYLTTQYTGALLDAHKRRRVLSKPSSWRRRKPAPLCPIYVPLRRCKASNAELLDDILDPTSEILPDAIAKKMPKRFIEHLCEQKRVLLLLDGLDEVADERAYQQVTEKINDFLQFYDGNKVIVTCRKAGWRGKLDPTFQFFIAQPLDHRQRNEFVHKWYASVIRSDNYGKGLEETVIQKRAEREANALLGLVRAKERLRDLASNPLMLCLICLVHRQRRDLPRGRAALYQECLEILLGIWDRVDKDSYQDFPTSEEKLLLLRRIAYRMHTLGLSEVPRDELEKYVLEFLPTVKTQAVAADIVHQIEVRSGLMLERAINKLCFSHLTLQEFLVVEYLRTEDVRFDVKTVKDWTVWREPVLLLCGKEPNPNALIESLYHVHPVLALEGIAEAEPVRLDLKRMRPLVESFITSLRRGKVEESEAIPVLVNLLSIAGNPFSVPIYSVITDIAQTGSSQSRDNLFVSLRKYPTREAARLALTLLTRARGTADEDDFLTGLIHIGDEAIYEALNWREEDKLTEEQLFNMISLVDTALGTRTLWDRYRLQPPPDLAVKWAQTWALRLTRPGVERFMRGLEPLSSPTWNEFCWPYRVPDYSPLAALVRAIFKILRTYYEEDKKRFYTDIPLIANFDMRVQVPLLIHFRFIVRKYIDVYSYETQPLTVDEQIELFQRCLKLGEAFHFPYEGEVAKFDEESWLALKEKEARIELWSAETYEAINAERWRELPIFIREAKNAHGGFSFRALALWLGLIVQAIAAGLATLGINALWQPMGTYLSLWRWLPLWAHYAVPGVALILTVGVGLWSYVSINGLWPDLEGLWQDLLLPMLAVGGTFLGIVFMPFGLILFALDLMGRNNQVNLFAYGRLVRRSALLALLASIGGGTLIYLGVRNWIGTTPAWLVVGAAMLLILLSIYLVVRFSISRANGPYRWLEKHPRGEVVLNEFFL